MTEMASSDSDFAKEVTHWLQANAAEYWDEAAHDEVRVTLTDRRVRTSTILYEFGLEAGSQRLEVLVKAARSDGDFGKQRAVYESRPILSEWCEPEALVAYEYNALRSIHEHIRQSGDTRLFAVRVFKYFDKPAAIAMERFRFPTLRDKMLNERWSRTHMPSPSLRASVGNAGAWLKAFHNLPRLEHTRPRRARREEFVMSVRKLADYLVSCGENKPYLSGLTTQVQRAADTTLTGTLPCALSHGDFAPRNVLVGPDQRVAAIDTSGRWWWPIYEDLGYMLCAVKLIGSQRLSLRAVRSPGAFRVLEDEFARGYFVNQPVPWNALRLYQIQALLATWAGAVHATKTNSRIRRPLKVLGNFVKARLCRHHVGVLVDELGR